MYEWQIFFKNYILNPYPNLKIIAKPIYPRGKMVIRYTPFYLIYHLRSCTIIKNHTMKIVNDSSRCLRCQPVKAIHN